MSSISGCSRLRPVAVGGFTTLARVSADGLLELALGAARDAGALLLERFGGPASGVESKSSTTDMVSDADRAAERLLLDRIAAARPDDGVLGEEGGRRRPAAPASSGWSTRSTAPPTTCSATRCGRCRSPARTPTAAWSPWCTIPAAARRSPPRAARGATLNGAAGAHPRAARPRPGAGRHRASHTRPGDRALPGRRVLTHVLPEVRDIRRGGSAALDLAWVACGRLDGFYEWGIKHWDRAAGMLLVAEAGGGVSVFEPGGGLEPCVVAAAADLHDPLRELVTAAIAAREPACPVRPHAARAIRYTQHRPLVSPAWAPVSAGGCRDQMTVRFEADSEAAAHRVEAWCGEPLLHEGEDIAVALAPGTVRRAGARRRARRDGAGPARAELRVAARLRARARARAGALRSAAEAGLRARRCAATRSTPSPASSPR